MANNDQFFNAAYAGAGGFKYNALVPYRDGARLLATNVDALIAPQGSVTQSQSRLLQSLTAAAVDGTLIESMDVFSINLLAKNIVRNYIQLVGGLIADPAVASGSIYGTYANRPAAGSVYFATDSPSGTWVYDESGAEWHPISPGGIVGKQPNLAAAWTPFNAGLGQALTDNKGALTLAGMSTADVSITLRGWEMTCSSPDAYIEVCMRNRQFFVEGDPSSFYLVGCGMRVSSTNAQLVAQSLQITSGVFQWTWGRWTNNTTRAQFNNFYYAGMNHDGLVFQRVRLEAGNVIADLSRDRQQWFTMGSSPTGTLGVPDRLTLVYCDQGPASIGIVHTDIVSLDFRQ